MYAACYQAPLDAFLKEGKILCWLKLVGDSLEKDEFLLEIETNKTIAEVPKPASRFVRAIFVAPRTTVAVGVVRVLLAEKGEPLPDLASLPRLPVSESTNDERQSSLVHPEWLKVVCAGALFWLPSEHGLLEIGW